jgi:hypothetical protein
MALLFVLIAFYLIDVVFDLSAKVVSFLLVLPFALIAVIIVIAKFAVDLVFAFSTIHSAPSLSAQKGREAIIESAPSRLRVEWVNSLDRQGGR